MYQYDKFCWSEQLTSKPIYISTWYSSAILCLRPVASGPSKGEDDTILRISRLVYNFHNSLGLDLGLVLQVPSVGVLHGHSFFPPTLPHRVRITITTLHAFTISRRNRTSVSSLLPYCGVRYHWADLYFDRRGFLWLPALAPVLA